MTTRQLTLLLAIRAGACSFRELNFAIGNRRSATGWMSQYLRELRAAGLVIWSPGQARTLQLTEAGHQATAGYLLSRKGERVTGVWKIDRVLTTRYSSPLVERESVGCTAEEYEELAS